VSEPSVRVEELAGERLVETWLASVKIGKNRKGHQHGSKYPETQQIADRGESAAFEMR
jgi:hypothetical protein